MTDAVIDWSTSDSTVVAVSDQGLAVARAPGDAQIVATSGLVAGAADITVAQRPASLDVPDGPLTLPLGAEADLTARVLDGGGIEVDGVVPTWSSRDTGIATVTSSGHVQALSTGSTWLVAEAGPLSDSVALTVEQSLAGLVVEPSARTLEAIDDTAAFTAVAVDALGQRLPGALAATWTSSDGGVAEALGGGRFRSRANGRVTVTATSGGYAATALLTVAQRAASMAVAVDDDTLTAINARTHAHVSAWDVRGNLMALDEDTIPFSVHELSILGVTRYGGSVSAKAPGEAWVLATLGTLTDSAKVVVRQDPWRVDVAGGTRVLNVGQSVDLAAQVLDSLGTVVPGTSPTWSSSDESAVTVDAAGTATAVDRGSAWITARYGDLADSITVTVSSVHQGDLVIADAGDLAAASAAAYEGVIGDLVIANTSLTSIDGLETIQDVTGGVTIRDNAQLLNLDGLSGLRTAAALNVLGNTAAQRLALPSLDSVARFVTVQAAAASTDVALPALRIVRGFSIYGTVGPTLSLPSLSVSYASMILDLQGARSISLGGLRCVDGILRVHGAALETVSAPALTTLGLCPGRPAGAGDSPADLILDDNPALTGADIPALASVAGSVKIRRTALTSLEFPALRTALNLLVEHDPIQTLSLPSLANVPYLVLNDVAAEEVDLPATGGQVWIGENAGLRTLHLENVGDRLDLVDNPALETLDLPAYGTGTLWIENNTALASVTFPALRSTDLLLLRGNTALESVSAPNMTSTGGIHLSGSPALTSASFPGLTTISGGLAIRDSALQDLSGFATLRSGLAGWPGSTPGLVLSGNRALTDLGGLAGLGDALGADPIVTGEVVITNNPSLPDATIQSFLDALEAKYAGTALPGGVTVSGNGGP